MPTDVRTSELVINKLSKQQYESIQNPSPTELYLVPDDDLREHRSYYTTGTAVIDGDTVDVDIMYEGVAPEGSLETDAVWTITTIVATLGGSIVSTTVDTEQTWDFPTPTPVVPVIGTTPPICYPTTATNVGTTSMDLKSSVSDNGLKLTEVGFVYSDSNQSPTVSDTKAICDLGCGNIKKSLSGLTLGTTYYIKSYGINQGGTSYGDLLTQSTIPSPIPLEYQLVEYLSGNYDAYICIENLTFDSIETIVTFLDLSTSSGIYGWRDSRGTNYPALGLFITSSNVPRTDFNRTQNNRNYSLGTHIITSDNINGKVYDNGIEFMTYTPINVLMPLFGLFTAYYSTTPMNASKMYLHKFKLGNQIELYPVYRKADNKPGMYDIVNNVFYTNQGTGEFTVGPDKEWDG